MADNQTCITPEFKAGFVALFAAKASKNQDGTMGAAKYSVRAFFPPNTDMSELKACATAAAIAKWGEKTPKILKSPFRTNAELENPVIGIPEDWILLTFSTNEKNRPGLVNEKNEDVKDELEIYSGCWLRAEVRAGGYETAGNKGVTFYLQNVQKLRNDTPLAGAKAPASKVFAPVAAAKPVDLFS